ncbi:HlyD family secretion protein [Aureivirga sp. CE67]|uniref:HlyD family secretion protein n=1 Tax=Aureivirga sp. CE67 TaxID=1788983 RepID=UPI0018CB9B8D|nr:biotin/lipoyl-binding protein [Aureivirga sp. CE67]
MLNISKNKSISKEVDLNKYSSFQRLKRKKDYNIFNKFLLAFFLLIIIIMFLPWTQNVKGKGFVTALSPDQRPQTIQSPIPGRIEKWYVKEGDFVKKGDTILYISEIKNEYQDPNLLERTREQRDAKKASTVSYKEKQKALEQQIIALQQEQKNKISQAKNKQIQLDLKYENDSIYLVALENNVQIAKIQYDRAKTLQEEGLKAVKDVEEKKIKWQDSKAKYIAQQNKLNITQNDIRNAELEVFKINATYLDKLSKLRGEIHSVESVIQDTKAQVSKLENQANNYEIRRSQHYITAPQDGIVNRAIRVGIGEAFKEGEQLVSILPVNYDIAVETFVSPIDLPLIHEGGDVRIQFEGWPVLFFSGWPNTSYGTFAGKVVTIESFMSENGKFRVLVIPDETEKEWPKNIKIGTGANTVSLLNDVPIWYELWRQLNGFPADYYTPKASKGKSSKKEKK